MLGGDITKLTIGGTNKTSLSIRGNAGSDYTQVVFGENEAYFGKHINGTWTPLFNFAAKGDLSWNFINTYNLTTSEINIAIPSSYNELLLYAGYPNTTQASQIYGAKSYIMTRNDSILNVIFEKEFNNASGSSSSSGGFYAYLGDNTLSVSCKNPPVRLRVYYR